jgi:hypothetical protein
MVLEVGAELSVRPDGAAELGAIPAVVQNIDAAFVAAVRTGARSTVLCDYREGLKSAAACIAANESAQSGRAVVCWNG